MDRLVTVLLPCHDAEPYLPAAVESLLTQTHERLEILAIDDGSTDGTLGVLRAYQRRDARVRVMVNEENLGLIATLNRGLERATGPFVARMDADDVSAPDRIELQAALLEDRSGVDVVGTGLERIDLEGRTIGYPSVRAVEPLAIDFLSFLSMPVNHASILARTGTLRRFGYRHTVSSLHAEDYELVCRMLTDGVGMAVLPFPLYRVRTNPSGVSRRFETVQVRNFTDLAAAHLERRLGMRLDPRVHRVTVNRLDAGVGAGDVVRGVRAVEEIRRRYLSGRHIPPAAAAEIDTIAHQQRWDIVIQALLKGTPAQRAAAALLLPGRAPALRHSAVRSYLASKLPTWIAPAGGGASPEGRTDRTGVPGEATS